MRGERAAFEATIDDWSRQPDVSFSLTRTYSCSVSVGVSLFNPRRRSGIVLCASNAYPRERYLGNAFACQVSSLRSCQTYPGLQR